LGRLLVCCLPLVIVCVNFSEEDPMQLRGCSSRCSLVSFPNVMGVPSSFEAESAVLFFHPHAIRAVVAFVLLIFPVTNPPLLFFYFYRAKRYLSTFPLVFLTLARVAVFIFRCPLFPFIYLFRTPQSPPPLFSLHKGFPFRK